MSREPSMEEILSSIRRVIARDEAARDASIEERFGDPANGDLSDGDDLGSPAFSADDDVLDLTEVETPTVTAPRAADDASPAVPIVSADSEIAARQAIEQLTAALDEGHADTDPVVGATPGMTIEAMAEAALRPMLKSWLDANLPPLVERLVAREIARITGGRI